MPQVISSDMKEDHIFRLMGKGADQDPKGVFSINKLTGEVAVSRALDREAIAFYQVSFTAYKRFARYFISIMISKAIPRQTSMKNKNVI